MVEDATLSRSWRGRRGHARRRAIPFRLKQLHLPNFIADLGRTAALETLLVSWQHSASAVTYEELHMNTRLRAAIGAIALVFGRR
jgi:hypothetical protein